MDHESVNIRSTTMSCGVMELSRIDSDVGRVLYQLASHLYHPSRGSPCAFFVWSDLGGPQQTTADELDRAVLGKELGRMNYSPITENPRTGNLILVYTWTIEHTKFKSWYRNERVKRMRRVGA